MSKGDASTSVPQRRYLTLPDKTVWPDPAVMGELEWRLRYAPNLSRKDQLVLASVVAAYEVLCTCTHKRAVIVRRGMREARKP